MKVVVGVGNPGARYAGTRHNVGFDVLDLLASRHRVEWEAAPRGIEALAARWRAADVLLAKPLSFVNLSGPVIVALLQFFKIEAGGLLVVTDDVNLELGRLRVRASGSAGGHNGLKSVIEALGGAEFPRLRVGVGRGDARRDLADHVLAKFDPEEREVVAEAIARAADAVELFVTDGIAPVMNRFNRKGDRPGEEDAGKTKERKTGNDAERETEDGK
ncbi:MAG TPA: aminoacyl-tRNA hydrolase [Vicinamibacterales bacterium]|jgi:PTH1 family peptidyl-tRNA hydrolase|nr:aminoacyl-tRNA hydrolase [Vicinamibacterales bacterium]